jgi:cellulose synthase/poly-beta-1,6-N-acetylglucosamine synthase-like glycosyltransferase
VAQDNVSIMRRVYNEGHEIGNHTFTHPDISEISPRQVELQLNLTERLFAAKLGVEPVYFRPPYSIDQEPDTNDQAEPIDRIEKMGYIILGDKIDTSDWDEHPRKSPQEIVDSVFEQVEEMKSKPWMRGSIILMHDGGGNRQATVDALPVLIQALRARGYEIVPVCDLLGKTRAETMPPLSRKQRWQARVDSMAFTGFALINNFIFAVFFVGDVLMSARLIIIGVFAVIDRFRKRKNFATPEYQPSVAVVIPAFNEEKVIVRTIRSVMMSSYKNLRIIVVDDGSTDRTAEVAREAYPADIASGRLLVLMKPNSGKAASLNYALNYFNEDIYIGIDADTVIAHDAIANLVPHFANPQIAAVAGNAKVGNRVNLWTRWQALEYITSQNFERRALDLFDVVMVVPGAIGAWRTSLVKAAGGYAADTVAEDADLTMNLLEQGYSVIYEDLALAFTEAPINADGLKRQRFRWSFGILQAIFKHRGAIKRHRAMGFFALPNILVFQIVLPLLSPFIDLFFVLGVLHYVIDRHFHPEAASAANLYRLLGFFLAFLLIDFATSLLAFSLERRHPASKGDIWLLAHIWLQRFTYRQVFSIVLFKTIKRAIDGKPFSWDKLERTALMSESTESITAGP